MNADELMDFTKALFRGELNPKPFTSRPMVLPETLLPSFEPALCFLLEPYTRNP